MSGGKSRSHIKVASDWIRHSLTRVHPTTYTALARLSTIKMKKTLLLCFIHGFQVVTPHFNLLCVVAATADDYATQGGEDTFGPDYQFTKHLRRLVAHALPKVNVEVLVYPKYETRGDLGQCVSRFRDW